MVLRRCAFLLWRWLWLIVLGTVVGAGAAYLFSISGAPTYESATRLLVNQAQNPGTLTNHDIPSSERLAKTYGEMVRSLPILEDAIGSHNLQITPHELGKAISVQVVPDTMILELKAWSTDPHRAAEIANAVAAAFIADNQKNALGQATNSRESLAEQLASLSADIKATSDQIDRVRASNGALSPEARQAEISRLQATLSQYQLTYSQLLKSEQDMRLAEAKAFNSVRVVEPARPSPVPVSPKTGQNTLLAALVGLMLAAGVALLIEYLDDTVKNGDEVLAALGAPPLGHVMRVRKEEAGALINAEADPRSPAAESFKMLRTNLDFALLGKPGQIILITSAGPGEGKTTVSVHLAQVMSQAGKRVILVDADLRRPSVHRYFGVERNDRGLTTALLQMRIEDGQVVSRTDGETKGRTFSALCPESSAELDTALRPTHLGNLRVLTSGPLPPNPSELLGSPRMSAIIAALKLQADVVLFDCPPALVVSDPTVLASRVDGVLVVVDAGRTRPRDLVNLREAIERAAGEGRVIGAVLNRLTSSMTGYYRNYEYHYEGESERGDSLRAARIVKANGQAGARAGKEVSDGP